MGYEHELDTAGEHEGWIAMTYADGAISRGSSNGLGHFVGDTYPGTVRPFAETVSWLPLCECGWRGIAVTVPDDADQKWREPSDAQEDLIMGQWRLHLRDALGAYQAAASA